MQERTLPKLITFDLDGTLLDDEKRLSPENEAALTRAAEQGAKIVPATGRFPMALPDQLKALPFLEYVIAINGALVMEWKTGKVLRQADISLPLAKEIWAYLAGLPVIYDCYQDGFGYMPEDLYGKIDAFITIPPVREMTKKMRKPLADFNGEMERRNRPVQKIQLYLKDLDLRERVLRELPERFPETVASSAIFNNIEINIAAANKGDAMLFLAEHLGIPRGRTMAFGDGTNDISMIRAAGVGVAMENGAAETKAAADVIAPTNMENGVAAVLNRYFTQ